MAGSDENFVGGVRPSNPQGSLMAGTGKVTAGIGRTRRARSTINQNFIGAAPYPCAVSKRGGLPDNGLIEQSVGGTPVSDIFKLHGESFFRDNEISEVKNIIETKQGENVCPAPQQIIIHQSAIPVMKSFQVQLANKASLRLL